MNLVREIYEDYVKQDEQKDTRVMRPSMNCTSMFAAAVRQSLILLYMQRNMYKMVVIGILTPKFNDQGFLHVLKSAQHIIAFLVAKNGLEQEKPITAKFQKKDQDIVHVYNRIDSNIDNVKELRKNIKDKFHDWFVDATRIANEIG